MTFYFKDITLSSKVGVFFIDKSLIFGDILKNIDDNGYIAHAIEIASANKSFVGDLKQAIKLFMPQGSNYEVVIVVGLGDPSLIDCVMMQKAGAKCADELNALKVEIADIVVDLPLITDVFAAHIAFGIKLRNYNFNKYFIEKKDKHQLSLRDINVCLEDYKNAEKVFARYEAIGKGVIAARDLVSEPANILYPESFVGEFRKQLEPLGIKLEILDERQMKSLGMNALLGVAQGSVLKPYTVVAIWNGAKTSDKNIALVGKGVCFDTGGINLKVGAGSSIAEMKYDMAGAATVFGVMKAIAERKAPINVIGAVGLVENMPSGNAQRPSDVVVSMSGQTIEVDNTDAEGRLVLADVLCYVQEKYASNCIVDIATLTGAITVALGDYYAGLFSNDDLLADQLCKAGKVSGEYLWRMPMGEHYDKQITSEIADVKNTGVGRGGGSITAAQFIKRFVKEDVSWAHLDIAAMAWAKYDNGLNPKGATGYGVRLLEQWLFDNFG